MKNLNISNLVKNQIKKEEAGRVKGGACTCNCTCTELRFEIRIDDQNVYTA